MCLQCFGEFCECSLGLKCQCSSCTSKEQDQAKEHLFLSESARELLSSPSAINPACFILDRESASTVIVTTVMIFSVKGRERNNQHLRSTTEIPFGSEQPGVINPSTAFVLCETMLPERIIHTMNHVIFNLNSHV